MKPNQDVRAFMRSKDVRLWEAAMSAGIGEATLVRWLRVELTTEKREKVMAAITAAAAAKEGVGA